MTLPPLSFRRDSGGGVHSESFWLADAAASLARGGSLRDVLRARPASPQGGGQWGGGGRAGSPPPIQRGRRGPPAIQVGRLGGPPSADGPTGPQTPAAGGGSSGRSTPSAPSATGPTDEMGPVRPAASSLRRASMPHILRPR